MMARKRFVTSEISTDRKIAKLAEKNPTAAALWPWFITAFDDWGRMNADPIEVKLTIFPAFPYTSDDVEEFIKSTIVEWGVKEDDLNGSKSG